VGLATTFYCLRFETSLFVASYDSQGYGGGIRPRLHTGVNHSLLHDRFYSLAVTMEIVGCLSVSVETSVESSLTRKVLTEPLPSNGLFRVYSLQRERVFGELLASSGLPL
jgi:hypothetical protein